MIKVGKNIGAVLKANSICSSLELLAEESYDLSQAEKKRTVLKDEQIHKLLTVLNENGQSQVISLSDSCC